MIANEIVASLFADEVFHFQWLDSTFDECFPVEHVHKYVIIFTYIFILLKSMVLGGIVQSYPYVIT